MVFEKIVKFLCCFIVWIQDFIKKFCKTLFCLSKKIEIFKIQNFIIYYFFFIFLAFLAFCFLFHLPKLVQKLWNFLWCFIGRIRDFTSDFWKILNVLLKKLLICEIFFFSKFCGLLFVFLFLYYIWHFIFNFVYLYLSKNSTNSYNFLFYEFLEILSKNFGKSWNIFQKNIDITNSKFFKNSIVSFFFYSFIILIMFFFPFSPIQSCQKILHIFLMLYYTHYRFYQIILENSWIFIKKVEILWIQNIFRIPSFTIWFFNFLVFLTSFFFCFTCLWFSKKL